MEFSVCRDFSFGILTAYAEHQSLSSGHYKFFWQFTHTILQTHNPEIWPVVLQEYI